MLGSEKNNVTLSIMVVRSSYDPDSDMPSNVTPDIWYLSYAMEYKITGLTFTLRKHIIIHGVLHSPKFSNTEFWFSPNLIICGA